MRQALRAHEWVQSTFGQARFSRLEQLEDYLEECAAAPRAGPTSLGPVLMGVRYVEVIGGVASGDCLAMTPTVKGYVASLTRDLSSKGGCAGRRKAPMLPLRALIGSEELVMSADAPRFLRAYA